jgi:hypothetical protein
VDQILAFLGVCVWELTGAHGGSDALVQYERRGCIETLPGKTKEVVLERLEAMAENRV